MRGRTEGFRGGREKGFRRPRLLVNMKLWMPGEEWKKVEKGGGGKGGGGLSIISHFIGVPKWGRKKRKKKKSSRGNRDIVIRNPIREDGRGKKKK